MKTRATVCTVYICSNKIVHFEKLFNQAACYYDVKNTQYYNKQNNNNSHTCYKQPYIRTCLQLPGFLTRHAVST